MPRLKLIEMDSINKMIYFRKDDKLIAFDAEVAIELISDSLDGKNEPVRHGHWRGVNPMIDTVECSECGYQIVSEELITPYCPNCGAKMDEEESDGGWPDENWDVGIYHD